MQADPAAPPRILIRAPRPIAAVVLDMDGTVLDTERVYVETFFETVAPFGYTLSREFLHSLVGGTREQFQAGLRSQLGDDFPYDDHRRAYLARRDELLALGIPIKPGVAELLDTIASLGLKSAIATAATRVNAEDNLVRAGLRGRFEVVVTRDDVEHSKPRPDIFLAAAAGIGTDPLNCLAVEDSHNGVRSAHAAGMMTVMVPDILQPTEEIRALCLAVLGDLHGVTRILVDHAPFTQARP
jgi:HAD superfamily hydrolase (TIGR01509 family)